jgi:protein-disulfide isomerase
MIRPKMLHKALLAATAAALCIGAAPPQSKTTVTSVSKTAIASHVIGDPAAKNTLVEYISYTCRHCADFEREGSDLVKLQFVGTGRLKFEVRHLLLNVIDLTVATATHCLPTNRFFPAHSAMLKRQDEWLGKASSATPAQQARWNAGTLRQRMQAVASDIGLYDIMENHGLSRAKLDQCLGDEGVYEPIIDQSTAAQQRGIRSTPTFELNGARLATFSAEGVGRVLAETLKR